MELMATNGSHLIISRQIHVNILFCFEYFMKRLIFSELIF